MSIGCFFLAKAFPNIAAPKPVTGIDIIIPCGRRYADMSVRKLPETIMKPPARPRTILGNACLLNLKSTIESVFIRTVSLSFITRLVSVIAVNLPLIEKNWFPFNNFILIPLPILSMSIFAESSLF